MNEVAELRERIEVLKAQVSETNGRLLELLDRVQKLEGSRTATLTLPQKGARKP